MARCAMLICTQ